jgi:hypothetical protein
MIRLTEIRDCLANGVSGIFGVGSRQQALPPTDACHGVIHPPFEGALPSR